jgi:hypothetical protein
MLLYYVYKKEMYINLNRLTSHTYGIKFKRKTVLKGILEQLISILTTTSQ